MFILKTPEELHLLKTSFFFLIFPRSTSRHHFVTRAYFATGKAFPCAQEIFSKRQLKRLLPGLLYLSLVCCDILVTFYTVVIKSLGRYHMIS